jgi:hypothetical protein
MKCAISIQGRWDKDAKVWTVTSHDVAGLVIEAGNWEMVIREIELILPDFLEISGQL